MRVRTMLVHGELDPLVPFSSAQAASQAIPNATFIPVPGLGHDLPPALSVELIERVAEFHSNGAKMSRG